MTKAFQQTINLLRAQAAYLEIRADAHRGQADGGGALGGDNDYYIKRKLRDPEFIARFPDNESVFTYMLGWIAERCEAGLTLDGVSDAFLAEVRSMDWPPQSSPRPGISMPAGEYYIGDPSYALDGRQWAKFFALQKAAGGDAFIYEGHRCYAHEVAGDYGAYSLEVYSSGNEHSMLNIDKGVYGILPAELVEQIGRNDFWEEEMIKEDFKEDFLVGCHEGLFRFGELAMDTAESVSETAAPATRSPPSAAPGL